MALRVIGSGFGRTGTRSLKLALEILGFAPCHHMEEVFRNPQAVPLWLRIIEGDHGQLADAFEGYQAQVDWPGAHVWRASMDAFPDALVIHSTRPPESWWKSYSKTIMKLNRLYRDMPLPPHITAMMDAMGPVLSESTFQGHPEDHDTCIAALLRREAEVRAAVPEGRLLVFDVAEGWEPICRFLDVPVPDRPFPHLNQADDFWAVLGGEPA